MEESFAAFVKRLNLKPEMVSKSKTSPPTNAINTTITTDTHTEYWQPRVSWHNTHHATHTQPQHQLRHKPNRLPGWKTTGTMTSKPLTVRQMWWLGVVFL